MHRRAGETRARPDEEGVKGASAAAMEVKKERACLRVAQEGRTGLWIQLHRAHRLTGRTRCGWALETGRGRAARERLRIARRGRGNARALSSTCTQGTEKVWMCACAPLLQQTPL